MDSRRLLDAVAAEFVTTGADTPPWPDPHPDMRAPLEEEYSRCPNPEKYRIIATRAEAWIRAATRFELAETETIGNADAGWRSRRTRGLDRIVRLRPRRPDAMPLVFGFGRMDDAPDTTTIVGAGHPAVVLTALPECGCDACDDGSDYYLGELDEHVLAVVSGAFVHVTTNRGNAYTTGDGYSASGDFRHGEIETLIADARVGRSRHPVVRGEPWWVTSSN